MFFPATSDALGRIVFCIKYRLLTLPYADRPRTKSSKDARPLSRFPTPVVGHTSIMCMTTLSTEQPLPMSQTTSCATPDSPKVTATPNLSLSQLAILTTLPKKNTPSKNQHHEFAPRPQEGNGPKQKKMVVHTHRSLHGDKPTAHTRIGSITNVKSKEEYIYTSRMDRIYAS